MYREIRAKKNSVDVQKTIAIVKSGSYGVLSTVGDDGYPYGVPVNYSYLNGYICFHCAKEGHKIDNIAFSDKVSFCVVTKSDILANQFDTDYESAVVFGRVFEVTDTSEKVEILMSILNKYSACHIDAGKKYMEKYWDETKVIKIKIEHLTGKTHV